MEMSDATVAARLLVNRRHIAVIGADDIDAHRRFFTQLADVPNVLRLQVYAQHSTTTKWPTVCRIATAPADLPPYTIAFLPDDPIGRLTVALAVLEAAGPAELRRLTEMPGPPVLMLDAVDGVSGRRARRLRRDYQLIVGGLDALTKGQAGVTYVN